MGIAQSYVLIIGNIDLSIGSMVGMSAMIAGLDGVDLSLNLSDSLSLADRLLLIQTNGHVREIKKEEFATVSRQIPWRRLYRE